MSPPQLRMSAKASSESVFPPGGRTGLIDDRRMVGIYETATRAELLDAGVSRRRIARALASGELVRARRDRYVSAAAPDHVLTAVRVGGRGTGPALLQLLRVVVFADDPPPRHLRRGSNPSPS